MNIQSLFVPFRCKSLDLKNRIVMPPMTRRRSPEGIPDEAIAACYARRAQHTELVRRLDRGDFDLVAVGRAQLQDPDWAGKVREGRIDDLQGFSKEQPGCFVLKDMSHKVPSRSRIQDYRLRSININLNSTEVVYKTKLRCQKKV